MPRMKAIPVSPLHEAARQAINAAMRPYADRLGAEGLLAVASAYVGQLVALQDQRTMTPAMAMEIVARNIESANHEMLANLRDAPGGSA